MIIDLHCHILPGIDDGAQTLDDSLEMAHAAVNDGVTHILCTPHHQNGKYINPSSKVIERVELLQRELDKRDIPLTLFEGQEVRVFGDIIDEMKNGTILGVDTNDKYILIEFPSTEIPLYTEQIFFELIKLGKIPVIVHPERNNIFIENNEELYSLIEMGALAQLTIPSYIGTFGKKIQKTALKMTQSGLVQVVASDAHNVNRRGFAFSEFYKKLSRDFGEKKVKEFKQNSRAMINGDDIKVNLK